jgi:hypothetical protein
MPAVIVDPERLTPGIRARACAHLDEQAVAQPQPAQLAPAAADLARQAA